MRFLSGRAVALTHSFTDDEETLSVPTVSVSVLAEDGTEVASGSATPDVYGNDSFNAGILPLGAYTAVWTGKSGATTVAIDTSSFEVTGGNLFSVKDVRASDADLAHAVDFPASEIIPLRWVVEDEFETITGRSFTPRVTRVSFSHDGSDNTWLGKFDTTRLIALSGPDGALDVSDYRLGSAGLLEGLSGLTEDAVYTATIQYGFQDAPADVRRVGMIRLRYLLAAESSGVPDRATSFVAAEGGTFTLATPGRYGYKTGIPEVDAVLSLYSYSVLRDTAAMG